MDVPETLEAWAFETVVEVVEHHEFEPGRYEFKEALHPTKGTPDWKAQQLESLRRTACSIANYDFGGFILFGVLDRSVSVPTPRDRIAGIPRSTDLRKELWEKLKPIQPEVYFDAKPIDIPGDPVGCILVAQIPTSSRRPHMFDERFYIRTEGGSARAMNVDEVRSQMLYTEARLQKVRLLQMELATFMEVCQMLNSPGTWSVRFDTSAFKVLLADICDMLQRDSGLLGLLHKIGTDAAALNQLLDRNEKLRHIDPRTVNNLVPALREEVTSLWRDTPERRAQLYNNCGKAQERLAAPFGPLPA